MNGILVTGGAGYIGSHVVQQLPARGERPLVLGNLSDAVLDVERVVGEVGGQHLALERFDRRPRYDDLDFIVGTAFRWEQKLAQQPYH